MQIYVNFINDSNRIVPFELGITGDFSALFKELEVQYRGILYDDERIYTRENRVNETCLTDGGELFYRDEFDIDGSFLSEHDLALYVKFEENGIFVEEIPSGVVVEQIVSSLYLNKSFKIYPFPKSFLPIVKDRSTLPRFEFVDADYSLPYRLVREGESVYDKYYVMNSIICSEKMQFTYINNDIDKSEKFEFDSQIKYKIKEDRVLNFIAENLPETKSVVSGSWPLNELLRFFNLNGFTADDFDVFSESLDLLFLLKSKFNFALANTFLQFSSSFMSYKFKIDGTVINYIHINRDGELKNNIAESSIERVLEFIKQKFDISCCITTFDGENILYNSSVLKKQMDVCAQITDKHVTKRICKYLNRGFKICEIVNTETCRRLYIDPNTNEEREFNSTPCINSFFFALERGEFEFAKIISGIIRNKNPDINYNIFFSRFTSLRVLKMICDIASDGLDQESKLDVIKKFLYDKYWLEQVYYLVETFDLNEDQLSEIVESNILKYNSTSTLHDLLERIKPKSNGIKFLKLLGKPSIMIKQTAFKSLFEKVKLEKEDIEHLFKLSKSYGFSYISSFLKKKII